MRYWLIVSLALYACTSSANDVHVRLLAYDQALHKATLTVGWRNGWNLAGATTGPANHDAVWLFMKGSSLAEGAQHLSISQAAVLDGQPFYVEVPADNAGIFVCPTPGRSFSADSCTIAVTLNQHLEDINQLDAYAIEMAHIPAGPFYAGDGASNNALASIANPSQPATITDTTSAISAAGVPINLAGTYPKGTGAFYIMKYELSQSAYADYLNTLPSSLAITHVPEQGFDKMHRNGLTFADDRFVVDGDGDGRYNTASDGLFRPCNQISLVDMLAYLDWAALRPITELEFEKAGRGPGAPTPKEFAWGNTCAQDFTAVADDGLLTEHTLLASNGCGPAVFALPVGQTYLQGPARQGFAAADTTSRVSSGTSYYGVFELSGNLWELCVRADAACFTAAHGDGQLDASGQSDQPCWRQATYIPRGGGWNSLIYNTTSYPFRDLATSDRFYQSASPTERRTTYGIRGGR